MGLFKWITDWGTAIKVVNTLDGAISQFPTIEEKKMKTLLDRREHWGDSEPLKKRVIDGYKKKVSYETVEELGQKYLDFFKTLYPADNGDEIQKHINVDLVENLIFKRIKNDDSLDPKEIDEIVSKSTELKVADYDSPQKIKAK